MQWCFKKPAKEDDKEDAKDEEESDDEDDGKDAKPAKTPKDDDFRDCAVFQANLGCKKIDGQNESNDCANAALTDVKLFDAYEIESESDGDSDVDDEPEVYVPKDEGPNAHLEIEPDTNQADKKADNFVLTNLEAIEAIECTRKGVIEATKG